MATPFKSVVLPGRAPYAGSSHFVTHNGFARSSRWSAHTFFTDQREDHAKLSKVTK